MMRLKKRKGDRLTRGGLYPPGGKPRIIGAVATAGFGMVGSILRHWKVSIVLGLVGIIYYQNNMNTEWLRPVGLRTIPSIVKESDERFHTLFEQSAECESSRERLKGEIAATNAQIEKWSALSGALQEQHDTLTEQLIDLAKASVEDVNVILQGPVPQTCEGAIKLLRDAATEGELKWPK